MFSRGSFAVERAADFGEPLIQRKLNRGAEQIINPTAFLTSAQAKIPTPTLTSVSWKEMRSKLAVILLGDLLLRP